MRIQTVFAVCGLAASLAACQTFSNTTVAEYCADPGNSDAHVCQLNVEIDGTSTALADTNLKLSEARALADDALAMANQADEKADDAMSRANSALSLREQLYCETRTLQQTNIGTCEPGYTVMSCTQTRYTFRAGGPSIMREINDERCRFHDRVLEMQVRCCMTASATSRISEASLQALTD
ncbi:MAG: hypothetical protein AAFX03_10520 [Pseudomonadota bacterium]